MKKLTKDMLDLGIGASFAGSAIKAADDADLGEPSKAIIAGGYATQAAKKLKLL